MKTLMYDSNNKRIYHDNGENPCYIQIIDDEGSSTFDVYYVPQFGGKSVLDSNCNTLTDALFQLDMVSV